MEENTPDSGPTRLAWLDWYTDNQGGKRCNYLISENPLSDSTVLRIRAIVDGIAKIRPLLLFFEIFRRNYLDLEAAYRQIDVDFEQDDFRDSDLKSIDRQALLQQRVVNFVNSSALMVERAKSRMNGFSDMNGFDLAAVEALESYAYDQLRSYRLCCNLRNYSQHNDLPIHAIPVRGRATPEGWNHSFRAVMKGGSLLEAKKKLRDIVCDDYDNEVDLISELQIYFFACAEIFAFIARPALGRIQQGIQLRKEVLGSRPEALPKAEPILWRGDIPADDGTSHFDGTSLSFQEIERWGATYKFIEDVALGFSGIFVKNAVS